MTKVVFVRIIGSCSMEILKRASDIIKNTLEKEFNEEMEVVISEMGIEFIDKKELLRMLSKK